MKIRKIEFKNHEMFRDLEVSFTNKEGEILDTTVIIGTNGSGKTSLLKSIYNSFDFWRVSKEKNAAIEVCMSDEEYKKLNEVNSYTNNFLFSPSNNVRVDLVEGHNYNKAKIVYMPTEINFNNIKKVDTRFKLEDKFFNEINQNITQNIPSFIATKIETEVFKNEELPPKESINKVCDEINQLFKYMDLDVKLIGLTKDEYKQPIFKNTNNDEFNIESLSSGEKQLFLRALSLKFLDINNSIILIDEPELSLHPQWQRKIIKVYESIGENNQLIIATHSPHVVCDIKKEQLRVLKRGKEGISIVDNDKLDETYGHTVELILKSIMGLNSVRNDETEINLKKLRNLLAHGEYDTTEFNDIYYELKSYLGNLDIDLNLIDLDIKRRKRKKGE